MSRPTATSKGFDEIPCRSNDQLNGGAGHEPKKAIPIRVDTDSTTRDLVHVTTYFLAFGLVFVAYIDKCRHDDQMLELSCSFRLTFLRNPGSSTHECGDRSRKQRLVMSSFPSNDPQQHARFCFGRDCYAIL